MTMLEQSFTGAFNDTEQLYGGRGRLPLECYETKSLVLVFARPVSSTQLPFVDVTDLRRMTNKDGNPSFAVTVKYNVQQIGTDDINRICYVVETDADPELAQSSVSTSHVYINVWKP